jgi:hypothetical protein
MKLFPTVLVFALLAVPALAAETDDATTTGKFTGNVMLPHCRELVQDDEATTPLAGLCAGMITTLFWSQPMFSAQHRFCAPKGVVTRGQSRQVILRYLESHPEKLHLDIRLLALDAMREAWPCKSWWQWW